MRRAPTVFREASRFIPARQRELREGFRIILRIVLIYGPVLGLLALWLVYWVSAGAPIPLRFLFLPLAPFTVALMFAAPAWISRIPALAPGFLHRWHLCPAVLLTQSATGSRAIPWTALHSPRVEETADEITLQVQVSLRGTDHPLALTCLRSEVAVDAVTRFIDAVNNKILRET